MSQALKVEKPKVAGFVDRGSNYLRKQKRLEEEEAEIARLEAKARGEDVQEEDEEEPEVEESEIEPVQKQKEDKDTEELSSEEKSFKKRYGDLRKHMANKEAEWKEELERVQKEAKLQAILPPKSDEDIEAWTKENPDIAAVVEKIAEKRAQKLFDKANLRLEELDKITQATETAKAEAAIAKAHPDFFDLRDQDDFHDWAEEQPKWVQDALYENADDPASVIRVIDLYKVDKGLTTKQKRVKTADAAKEVKAKVAPQLDADETKGQIKESDVARMSDKEFEDNEEKIRVAQQTGKFIYDISGSAR